MKTVYLDNNATTQVAAEVLEAMLPYFRDLYGNPSSMHSFGGQVAQEIREARKQVAALIGATPEEIIFTSVERKATTRPSDPPWPFIPTGVILSPAAWNIPPLRRYIQIWPGRAIT